MAGGTMGQVHHGSATTAAIRRAIQHSQESLRALAKRYGVNQKTIAKWKRRTSVADVPTGPTEPRSDVVITYNPFRHGVDPAILCAVPNDRPVPAFITGPAWCFESTIPVDQEPAESFRPKLATT